MENLVNQSFPSLREERETGLNPRPRPWQGRAPPTDHSRICKLFCICLSDTFDIILWETGFVNKFFEIVIMKAENHAFWRKKHFLI